jgi:hypothetical protein
MKADLAVSHEQTSPSRDTGSTVFLHGAATSSPVWMKAGRACHRAGSLSHAGIAWSRRRAALLGRVP